MNNPNHALLTSCVAGPFIDAGANGDSSEQQPREAFGIVVLAAVLLILPVTLTLRTIVQPGRLEIASPNPSPLGYTWSLLLFIVPLMPLCVWFAIRRDLISARRAFWPTIATLLPLGFVLDLLFGNAFFSFPNGLATLGWKIPALGGPIPIEEFVFYVTGFMLVLLSYIWADEYWLRAYQTPNYLRRAGALRRISGFHLPSMLLGAVLIGAAVLYKKTVSASPQGVPCYFIYLTLTSLVPCAGFLRSVWPFVNWRAFGFTFGLILLLSLLWEVTLALPNGWWGYEPAMMIGLNIGTWHNLPVEAVYVWFAASFTTVIAYEVTKIRQAREGAGDGAWIHDLALKPSNLVQFQNGAQVQEGRHG